MDPFSVSNLQIYYEKDIFSIKKNNNNDRNDALTARLVLLEREENVLKTNSCWINYLCTTAAAWHDIQMFVFFKKRGPLFDFTASRLSHLNLLYSQQLVLMI